MKAIDDRVYANLEQGGVRPSSHPQQYFIYCVGQEPDRIDAFLTYCLEEDIGVKPLYGTYNGQPEESFISNWKDFDAIQPWLSEQQSILFLDSANIRGHRKAKLIYRSGWEEDKGLLRQVTRRLAIQQPSWTYDPYTDAYFVCT
jgi:hypothetical protein